MLSSDQSSVKCVNLLHRNVKDCACSVGGSLLLL